MKKNESKRFTSPLSLRPFCHLPPEPRVVPHQPSLLVGLISDCQTGYKTLKS
uniref:Uncharacterized protein n=1 Tax=Anguilla anguilla TaxID=7936 RepID=A0A0E9QYL1_ANGAN